MQAFVSFFTKTKTNLKNFQDEFLNIVLLYRVILSRIKQNSSLKFTILESKSIVCFLESAGDLHKYVKNHRKQNVLQILNFTFFFLLIVFKLILLATLL